MTDRQPPGGITIPESTVKRIISDYKKYLLEHLRKKLHSLPDSFGATPITMDLKNQLMSVILSIEDDAWGKPYIAPWLQAIPMEPVDPTHQPELDDDFGVTSVTDFPKAHIPWEQGELAAASEHLDIEVSDDGSAPDLGPNQVVGDYLLANMVDADLHVSKVISEHFWEMEDEDSKPLADEGLEHIMGWCSAIEHNSCWYRDNCTGLSEDEQSDLQRLALIAWRDAHTARKVLEARVRDFHSWSDDALMRYFEISHADLKQGYYSWTGDFRQHLLYELKQQRQQLSDQPITKEQMKSALWVADTAEKLRKGHK